MPNEFIIQFLFNRGGGINPYIGISIVLQLATDCLVFRLGCKNTTQQSSRIQARISGFWPLVRIQAFSWFISEGRVPRTSEMNRNFAPRGRKTPLLLRLTRNLSGSSMNLIVFSNTRFPARSAPTYSCSRRHTYRTSNPVFPDTCPIRPERSGTGSG